MRLSTLSVLAMSEQKLAWLFGLSLGGMFTAVLLMNALAY
jgi:hypothetical protein